MKPVESSEISPLFFAINHYVSTGDHFGEGVGAENGQGELVLFVPVRRDSPDDSEGFRRFEARLEQLRKKGLTLVRANPEGKDAKFDFYSLVVPRWHVEELSQLLTQEPGPLGWGAIKATIDAHRQSPPPPQPSQGRDHIPDMIELLIVGGKIESRYVIDKDRHSEEALDFWRPLIARLMDRPADRVFHGLVDMPYWEASLVLSPMLAHPELANYLWLCLYDDPKADEPFYVGLLVRSHDDLEAAHFIAVVSGGKEFRAMEELADSVPCLVGTHWLPGMPRGIEGHWASQVAAGEVAAILAQLILEATRV